MQQHERDILDLLVANENERAGSEISYEDRWEQLTNCDAEFLATIVQSSVLLMAAGILNRENILVDCVLRGVELGKIVAQKESFPQV